MRTSSYLGSAPEDGQDNLREKWRAWLMRHPLPLIVVFVLSFAGQIWGWTTGRQPAARIIVLEVILTPIATLSVGADLRDRAARRN